MRNVLYALVGFSICSIGSEYASAAEPGQAAGELALLRPDGTTIVVNNHKDWAATVIVFLSSRSDVVDGAIDEINRLHRLHRRRGVLYVGICPNNVETADELRDYAQARGVIFAIYRDPEGKAAQQLGVRALPTAVVVDRGGKIKHRGPLVSAAGIKALDATVSARGAGSANPTADDSKATPIDKVGPKREVADRYGNLAFAGELVFEKIPHFPAHHCSTIAEAPNGDLLCLWYGGSYESADDQVLFLARRPKGSRAWQTPEVLIGNLERPPGNGVIFTDGAKRVWVVWCRMESRRPIDRGKGWNNCRLFARMSSDSGKTWSADAEIALGGLSAVPRNPPLLRNGNELVLPVEADLENWSGSTFLIGTDNGTRWRRGGLVTGGSQPALIERNDGSLFALLRRAPRLTQVQSSDGGANWTKAVPSAVDNPGAGISMTRLRNGHIVLVFNNSPSRRTPLSVARSLDEGRTWQRPLDLESNPGEYSYPCVIQSADGKIHVTYTFRRYSIKHVEFNEDWLVHSERPN